MLQCVDIAISYRNSETSARNATTELCLPLGAQARRNVAKKCLIYSSNIGFLHFSYLGHILPEFAGNSDPGVMYPLVHISPCRPRRHQLDLSLFGRLRLETRGIDAKLIVF